MYGEIKKLIWLNYSIHLTGELNGLEPNPKYLWILPLYVTFKEKYRYVDRIGKRQENL